MHGYLKVKLRSFVSNKFPEDRTLVSKHVIVGTLYEVCYMVWFIVFYLCIFLVKT